MSNVIFKLVN